MSERRAELARAIPSEEEEDEVNRRTSERRAELAQAIPSEEEEDESQPTHEARAESQARLGYALQEGGRHSQRLG